MVPNKAYLSLIRLGIGHQADIPAEIDWKAVRTLATKQGLAAIVLDGIKVLMEKASESGAEDKFLAASALAGLSLDFKLDWVAESVVAYEQRYADYRTKIAELADFYNKHGLKMMVLKGYGLSLNYPVPSHRPSGDIDTWMFGEYKKADDAVAQELGIKIDKSHHHHTTFDYKGFLVENHYDFINVHYGHQNDKLEDILKSFSKDDSNCVAVDGQTVYLPCANLHALFQIRHSILHFASSEINLRHLLDWGFFVEKHSSKIDWKWLCGVMEEYHMKDFFNYINVICVEDLGFEEELFPAGAVVNKAMKERILADMISPEFAEEMPAGLGFFRRVVFRYRRWQANAWKQRLCYKGSRFVAFWRSVYAHLLKPESI